MGKISNANRVATVAPERTAYPGAEIRDLVP